MGVKSQGLNIYSIEGKIGMKNGKSKRGGIYQDECPSA